jgi:short-subunit dehydrogenase
LARRNAHGGRKAKEGFVRIVITGCPWGIGRTLARYFGERGHDVFATARNLATLDGLIEDPEPLFRN